MTVFQDELVGRLEPIVAQGDWEILLRGIGAMFGEIELLARDDEDGNPGWSILLDVDRVPTQGLPYLAQIVGLLLPTGSSDADARAAIRWRNPWRRGTVDALVRVGKLHLSGGQQVIVHERDKGAYHFSVVTYAKESPNDLVTSPGVDVEIAPLIHSEFQYSPTLLEALEELKPAGLRMRIDVLPGWEIQQMEAAYSGQTIAQLEAAFPVTESLETHVA